MKNRFFDIDELDSRLPEPEAETESRSALLVSQFLDRHFMKVKSIKELTGRLPAHGDIYFLGTLNSFNAFTFITFLIREQGTIDDLIISTYSINIRIINALIRLIDKGQILKVTICVSDSICSQRTNVYNHLIAITEHKPVRVIYAYNHSKIALVRIGSEFFTIEGSGNWSENAQHEQYIFTANRDIYEFRKNWILHDIDPVTA